MAWTAPRTWATGEIVTASILNTHVRDNLKEVWREVAYAEVTANTTVTATTAGTANTVVTAGAITGDAAAPVIVTFGAHKATIGTSAIYFELYDGASTYARIGEKLSGTSPVLVQYRFTPSAASHTYSVRAWVDAGTGTVFAGGGGGSGNATPAFIRIEMRGY